MPVRIDPNTGERIDDAVATRIDPATGERIEAPAPQQKGMLSSFADASGLSAIPQLIAHPIDSVTGAVKQAGQNISDAYSTVKTQGATSDAGRHAIVKAIPLLGPVAATAGQQALDRNYKGLAGTVAGAAFGAVAPELGGRALGSLRVAAPSVYEGALNLSKVDRAYGKTPGVVGLRETTGVRPETVMRSAANAITKKSARINAMADAHTAPIDITPAVDSVDADISTAKSRNNVAGHQALQPVRAQLTENPFQLPQPYASPSTAPSTSLAPAQTARQALDLKRGLRDQFVKNWNPDAASVLTRDSARNASGVLDSQLDAALGPDFAKTNQEISSLIPVADAAESTSRNAHLLQKVIGRTRAHTGALTAGLAGASAGAVTHGTMGGLVGGALGLAIPEMIGGPTATMIMARGLNSRVPSMVARPIFAAPYVAPRYKDEQ